MNELVLTLLPIGLTFGFLGFIFTKYPPVINTSLGYRTPFSKKNADTWAVANSYFSKLRLWEGIVLTILGFIALMLPDMHIAVGMGSLIGISIVLPFVVIMIASTEIHLHKVFDEKGNRRG